jgi:hypothetical protein
MSDQGGLKPQQRYERITEAWHVAASELVRSEIGQTERWRLRLAASYENAERLSRLIDETCRWLSQRVLAPQLTPNSVPEIEAEAPLQYQPWCSACNVPLWFVSVDDSLQPPQWVFECRACDMICAVPPCCTDEQLHICDDAHAALTSVETE